MHNSTDSLDDLLGLYESPLAWAREALPLEHNADDYNGDADAFLLDVLRAGLVTFATTDCGITAVHYHG